MIIAKSHRVWKMTLLYTTSKGITFLKSNLAYIYNKKCIYPLTKQFHFKGFNQNYFSQVVKIFTVALLVIIFKRWVRNKYPAIEILGKTHSMWYYKTVKKLRHL